MFIGNYQLDLLISNICIGIVTADHDILNSRPKYVNKVGKSYKSFDKKLRKSS